MIPLWRRPDVVRMFVWSMERTLPSYIELEPFFIISPEDPDYKSLKKIIKGYKQFEYKNNPLGEKKNKGIEEALKLDWDYYMDMGSDNIWTALLWDTYKPYFESGDPYFGMQNMYSIDLQNYKAIFSPSYHRDSGEQPTALGVARVIRRDVVLTCKPLFEAKWTRGMDGISHSKITQKGYTCEVIDNEELPILLDIKTEYNLTPFLKVEHDKRNKEVDVKQVYEWFGLNDFMFYNQNHTGRVSFDDFREEILKRVNIYGSQSKAFESINSTEKRYSNYSSYRSVQTKQFKK